MKLLRRFGKFLNRYEAETTAILVILILILLLFEFYFEVSGTKFLELLPSIVVLVSAVLLFCALLQSIKANMVNRQKVTYERYLEILQHYEEEGNEVCEFTELNELDGFEFLFDDYNFRNGSVLIKEIFNERVFEKGKHISSLFEFSGFINAYISFYRRLSAELLQLKIDNLLPEYDSNLLDRFADLFAGFNSLGIELEEFEFSEEITNYSNRQDDFIRRLLSLHKPLYKLLYERYNRYLFRERQ